jgi:asparagine synthase (glutamine-hydrolysing)
MCGIAGAVGRIDADVIEAVRRAGASQSHRGPDAHGEWTSSTDSSGFGVALAHRRLAIIDLSERGRQPMVDPETGNVLCFNGEIYNFRALRKELEGRNVGFASDSDSEVILKAYAVWGESCVNRLRGMFAFAIWDANRRSLLLARDRLGIKPLYVAPARSAAGDIVLFASELRALLATGLVDRRLNPAGVDRYLWNGFVTGPGTIVSGVQLFPEGNTAWLAANRSRIEPKRYWRLPRMEEARDTAAGEGVSAALQESVSMRLVSDVPLGVFLSGGVDSSALAALAVRASPGEIRTFNISFAEAEFDEAPHARAVARALGTQHEEIRLTGAAFQGHLEQALASLDQPTFDAINTYYVSRAVREAGITVALSGAGGDELFGGYRSFVDLPRARRWARRLAPIPVPLLRNLATTLNRVRSGASPVPPQTRWGKLADALGTRGDLVSLYQVAYALFSSEFRKRLRPADDGRGNRFGLPAERLEGLETLTEGDAELHAISNLELSCFVGDRLLRDTDTTSMAVSLEVRVPLLDHEVVAASAAIPLERRYAPLGRKQVLRDVGLSGLDPALFERPKAGFVLPLEAWTRDTLADEIDLTLRDSARCESVGLCPNAVADLWDAYRAGAPGLYWSRIWALFVLMRWTRAYGVTL